MTKVYIKCNLVFYIYGMRITVLSIFLILIFGNCYAQKHKAILHKNGVDTYTVYNITGTVTDHSDYCGGVEPSDQMIRELGRHKPCPHNKLYIKRGTVNSYQSLIFRTIKPLSDGSYCVQLPPGVYCIILETQIDPLDMDVYKKNKKYIKYSSEECLKKWWKTCYQTLVVKDKDISNLNFHFHHKCFVDETNPCIEYVGPQPP